MKETDFNRLLAFQACLSRYCGKQESIKEILVRRRRIGGKEIIFV